MTEFENNILIRFVTINELLKCQNKASYITEEIS